MADNGEMSRVLRSTEQARVSYDRISRWYDLLEGMWERKAVLLGIQQIAIKAGERALEIGAGTGHGLVAMAGGVGDTGGVCDLDLSLGMIRISRSRVVSAGYAERMLLTCGDAARLPYAAESFDAVFMSFVLELFDTPLIPVVLQECRRVLRGGGRICVVSLSRAGGLNGMGRLYEWGHRQFPAVLDCRLIYPRRALEDASLEIVEDQRFSLFGLPVEIVLARKPG
jgi:ubiquinone/menaquinone biosynthesis C-methylase UbiE